MDDIDVATSQITPYNCWDRLIDLGALPEKMNHFFETEKSTFQLLQHYYMYFFSFSFFFFCLIELIYI